MPSGYGPSRGKTTPGWVTDDEASDPMGEDLHLPGLRAARRAAAPAGRPAAGFCDLEEHNALTAHQERQRLRARQES